MLLADLILFKVLGTEKKPGDLVLTFICQNVER